MKKRLISLIVAVVMLFSMLCPAAYADNETVSFDTCTHEWETPLRSGYSITIPGSDVSFSVKTEQCKNCKWYKHVATIIVAEFTYYSPLNVDANGLVPTELATYWANVWYNTFGKDATATKFTPGGGSTDGSGVGRRPAGYADDDGSPSVSSSGFIAATLEPYAISAHDYASSWSYGFRSESAAASYLNELDYASHSVLFGASGSGLDASTTSLSTHGYRRGNFSVFKLVAPVSGIYFIPAGKFTYGTFCKFSDNEWDSVETTFNSTKERSYSATLQGKGTYYFFFGAREIGAYAYRYTLYPFVVYCEPLGDADINNYNNISALNLASCNNMSLHIYPILTFDDPCMTFGQPLL